MTTVIMDTTQRQEGEKLNPKSVCRLIEDGKNLKTYQFTKKQSAVKDMHNILPVLLRNSHARCFRVSIDTTDLNDLRWLFSLRSLFSHLNVSDRLDLYMDKIFQFFHNVQNSLSSNHLPPELQLNCCSNKTYAAGCELDRDSIINTFVLKMLELNRCDIIKLMLQQHGMEFSAARLNGYLQIAAMLYQCEGCFQELQSHGADINYLRNQPDVFDNFFRSYHRPSKKHDHAILRALFDSDFVVRSQSHFYDLCYEPMESKTRRLLIQQMCVRCDHEENYLKLQAQFNMPIKFVPSEVFVYLWKRREWDLIGIYYYAGYYPELSYFRITILKYQCADGINSLCHWIYHITGFVVPKEWIRNSISDSGDNTTKSTKSIIQSMKRNPRKLENCCVISIRKALCTNVLYRCKQLPLPEQLKKLIILDIS